MHNKGNLLIVFLAAFFLIKTNISCYSQEKIEQGRSYNSLGNAVNFRYNSNERCEDKTITANVIITRGTSNPDFQQAMKSVYLLISSTPFVGTGNKEDTYSVTKTVKNTILDNTYSISSKGGPVTLHNIKKWYVRVGARINQGLNRYNVSTVKEVIIP